jgi:transposase InsO family protein
LSPTTQQRPRNGIEHLLTAPRSPTTTGKIERFHRTMRAEPVTGTLFTDHGARRSRGDRA